MPESIVITEVGPRDGLQNEPRPIGTDKKVGFINLLSAAGVSEIEVSSFVSPKWVPQLGDARDVFEQIDRHEGVVYSALVPNERGLEGALGVNVDKIAVFTAASETFSQRNTNATIAQTLERFAPVIATAKEHDVPVRAYISCVVACPYEGSVDPEQVRQVAETLLAMGTDEIDLGETIGVAAPSDIERLFQALDGLLTPGETTLHLHDTRGTALACAARAFQLGVRRFDASAGGLGGCPYAPGAAGNLATEDIVYMFERMGIATNIALPRLFDATRYIADALGRELPGRVFRADGCSSGMCAPSS